MGSIRWKTWLAGITGIVGSVAIGGARVASAEPPVDPCALLSRAQITAALGMPVGSPRSVGTTACQWATPNQPNSAPVTVTVALWEASAFSGMKAQPGNAAKTRAVDGLGDDAIFSTVAGQTTLSVKKGDVAFVVRLYGLHDEQEMMRVEKALAAAIVAKL